MNEDNDEIVIGVNVPKQSKNNKKKNNNKKNKKEVVKKTTSKDKKTKARILGNHRVFRDRMIRKFITLFLVIIAIILFFSSSIFDVSKIEIEKNEMVSEAEIKSLLQLKDINIFNVNKKILKKKLESNPYIEDIEMERILPSTLKIVVKERKPKFMVQLGDAFVFISSQGYILDISSEKKELPIIVGVETDISKLNQKGNRLDKNDLGKFDVLNRIYDSANNDGLLPLISLIDISDPKNYTLHLDSEMKIVYLGNCSDLNTRMLYVNAIIEQEKGIEGEIFVNVDLNEQNVYFREKI